MGLQNREKYAQDLKILKGMVKTFEEEFRRENKNPTLFDVANAFVFDMSSSAVREEDKDGVCITTIHNAKGLEWRYVFLIGLEEENFPGTKLSDTEDLESERRLAYVAFTRAKDELHVFASQTRAALSQEGESLKPSRFLMEAGLAPSLFLTG